MDKPNIFNIATSELSQDAFFVWLFKWGDPVCKQYNEDLCICSQQFISFLINKEFDYKSEIVRVKAGRQWNNIDIWAQINNEVLIIIEDKTTTFEHSNQLIKYKKFTEDWCFKNNYKLVMIFLKTGTEFVGNSEAIETKGFKYIDRTELINFFKNHSHIKNDILQDYCERLKNIDKVTNSFEELIIKEWDNNSWIGFYKFLEKHLPVAGWKYVPNRAGGFFGLWLQSYEWKDYKVYLQIEQGKLCFKIAASKNRKTARDEWYRIIIKNAKEQGFNEIKKPKRFGHGEWMTVAMIEKQNWLGSDDSVIEKDKIVFILHDYNSFIKKCVEQ